tara:strand:+ start:57 stop:347 length:291 start_codon:yes stop_codon:yes gene_type:complete
VSFNGSPNPHPIVQLCLLTVIEFNPDAASFSVGDTYFNRICCIIQMFRFSSLLKPHDLSTERTGKKKLKKIITILFLGFNLTNHFFSPTTSIFSTA